MDPDFLRRQCAGFLATPPLWVKEQFGIRQFPFPEIDLKGFAARPIPKQLRLGHQMEQVFKQFLQYDRTYEIILHNLPIKREKQTLGEIDFILRQSTTPQLIHIEMAYKFYIINTEISEPIHRLMGPNKRDMFFTKMEKIRQEQFPLLHTKEGKQALSAHHIDVKHLAHQACFKAQLFAPYGVDNLSIRPLNTDCISGFWIRFDTFNSEEFKAFRFYIPSKSEWVMTPHDHVPWTSHFETLMEVNLRMLRERAPLLWMRKPNSGFERFFVVWW